MTSGQHLPRRLIIALCFIANVDERCARRWLRGAAVWSASRERLEVAALQLGIAIPAPVSTTEPTPEAAS